MNSHTSYTSDAKSAAYAALGRPGLRLPFEHLNLRRNPFGHLSTDETAQLAMTDLRDLIPRLSNPRQVIQFLGDKGFGKTTHALALGRQFPNSRYTYLVEDRYTRVAMGSPIIVDEAQRLRWFQLHWLARQPIALVLATHVDFSRVLQRYGRSVETVVVGQHTNATTLMEILNRRIQFFRRNPGPVPAVQFGTAQSLLNEHGSDVRSILQVLYDRIQQQRDLEDV